MKILSMKILLGYGASEQAQQHLRAGLPSDVDIVGPFAPESDEFLREVVDADAVLGFSISEEALARAKRLRLFQFPWTGIDTLSLGIEAGRSSPLSLQTLASRRIVVCNSHANSLTIAEHAFALIMSAAKHIVPVDQRMRRGDWRARREGFQSVFLAGSTLGIVGLGAIGRKVARMASQGFGMKVIGIRRQPGTEYWTDPPVRVLGGREKLQELLSTSDFVLITVPLTQETDEMIGARELAMMKPTGILVNVSRGRVVNQQALYEALIQKKIGGAAIEAWWRYPERGGSLEGNFQDFPFERLENIVLSPHRAWRVVGGDERHLEDVIENIRRFLDGRELINVIDPSRGY